MTYDEFKQFILNTLWRNGDPEFEGDLDLIIRMAEARLSRDLDLEDMVKVKTAVVEDNRIELPEDYFRMRTITGDGRALVYKSPHEFEAMKHRHQNQRFQPVYTTSGDTLHVLGPFSVQAPLNVTLTYYSRLPSFKDTNASWVADRYLDLFVHAVLMYTPVYMRDDERLAPLAQMYEALLMSANDADRIRKYAGSPLVAPLPGNVM